MNTHQKLNNHDINFNSNNHKLFVSNLSVISKKTFMLVFIKIPLILITPLLAIILL
jgi:hypothetical protein